MSQLGHQSLLLKPFAASPLALEVFAQWVDQALVLRYELTGPVGSCRWPDFSSETSRAQDLWKSTCFEIFVMNKSNGRYLEWNVSPSGHWDVHSFSAYRERADFGVDPIVWEPFDRSCDRNHLRAMVGFSLRWSAIRDALGEGDYYWQPTAVLETTDGVLSYWALAHPKEQPDFHAWSNGWQAILGPHAVL